MSSYKITKKETLPESLFVIEGEISVEALAKQRKNALDKFQEILSMDGFRKGHIPEKNVVEKVGEIAILEEAGTLTLEKNYADIIKEAGISPIGQPKVSVTKIVAGEPLTFKIETAVAPEVKLPNYKKIAKAEMAKEETVEVTEKDMEDAIKEIRESVAHHKLHQTQGETENHDHNFTEADLPVFDDAFVKTLGKFESVEDFKEKFKVNLLAEKKGKAREKKRYDIMEEILKDTKVDVPAVLTESELLKMIGQLKDQVAHAGLEFDAYLKQVGKTEQDIHTEWKDEARKRATLQLVLNKIFDDEKLELPEDEIKHQTEQLVTYYKDANPVNVRIYVESMMVNEKAWKFLEDQK
jgi:FKBP-type peptidyl-prolyl cis-trans isomerase (trigger factor)